MAHDPRILSFYVDQIQTRQRRQVGWQSSNYGEMLLACLAIMLAVSAFLFLYDQLVHRDPLYIPTMTASAGHNRPHTARLTRREAPAPDMSSPEVALANADVPEESRIVVAPDIAEPTTASLKPVETVPHRKRKTRVAKRHPRPAGASYAAAPGLFGFPFGSF